MPPDPPLVPGHASDDIHAMRAVALLVAAEVTLAQAADVLSTQLAKVLGTPIAVLSRDAISSRFEAHAFPDATAAAARAEFNGVRGSADPVAQLHRTSGVAWTAVGIGTFAQREWTLLLPGQSSYWASHPGIDQLVQQLSWSLGHVAEKDLAEYSRRLQRTIFAFSRRLARDSGAASLNSLVLRTLASQVHAQTAALARFNPDDGALQIVATLGYPLSVVEHLRIPPGEGLLGRVYETGHALVGDATSSGTGRLRYRSDSYMVLPVIAGANRAAVVALTDRADGRRFDARDFSAARLLVATAAPAFAAEPLRRRLVELTELATVEPVTGLFNRRYLQTRLEAEVERARRQGQDLALLLIDVDDFKRVNDTRGHLEGDRTLREIADLIRAGVRIFDVCARYGGEEFVIVMPAASLEVAQQVAERVRGRVERRFARGPAPVTVSIGVGTLAEGATGDELLDVADRALMSAKRAGKNIVWVNAERERPAVRG